MALQLPDKLAEFSHAVNHRGKVALHRLIQKETEYLALHIHRMRRESRIETDFADSARFIKR